MDKTGTEGHSLVKKKKKVLLTISLSLALLMVASFIFFTIASLNKEWIVTRENALINNKNTINNLAEMIENSSKDFEELIGAMAKSGNLKLIQNTNNKQAVADIISLFKTYKEANNEITNIFYGIADKRMILYPDLRLPSDYDPTGRSWYKNAVNNKRLTWSDPYIDIATGDTIFTISVPIYNQNDCIGVLAMDLNYSSILDDIKEVKMGNMGYLFITDRNSNIVYHPDIKSIGRPSNLPALAELTDNHGELSFVFNGEERSAVYHKIENLDIHIIGILNESEYRPQAAYLIKTMIYIGMLLLAFVLICIFLIVVILKG